jgi:subtilisin family serine protease
MRALSVGLLASLAALVLTPPAGAQEVPDAVSAKLAQGSGGVAALWADGARLPVIVEFAMPPVPDPAGFDSPADADAARTQAIRAAQDAILIDLLGTPADLASAEGSPDTNLKRMAFSPMFGMVATAEDVERLAADPRVIRIHEDALSTPQLVQSVPLIGMPAAYAAGATGNGFHVAVLDTGGRRSHEFLSSRIVSAACYSTTRGAPDNSTSLCPGGVAESTTIDSANDCDAATIFGCGHGTHVAGTAAGFNTNQQAGEPANGVARDARIISINVFSRFARSSCRSLPAQYTGGCVLSYNSDQIKGLERVYALRNEMNIAAVNMSLGASNYTTHCDTNPLKPIIDQLREARIATVISAGNDGRDTAVGSPGCISSAITVASSTKQDARSSFSNWGPLVDVVAPGSDIRASDLSGASNTFYAFKSGTSMAAPHVAGAFAAMRSVAPNATVSQIEDALESTGLPITIVGTTKPRIRVAEAVTVLTSPPPAPANDNFSNRVTIASPRTVTGTSIGATAQTGEPNHAGDATARKSVWWRYTPAVSGLVTINTLGSNFDTVLAIYTGSTVGNLTPVASNDDFSGPQSQAAFQGTAGTSYAIAVAGKDNTSGSISLTVLPPPPANDDFANAITLPGFRTVTGSNAGATSETGEPNHAGVSSARSSVWWRFTPSQSGQIVINTFGSDFDTVLGVYRGTSVSSLTSVASNDNTNGAQSRVVFEGTAGTTYSIAVAGRNFTFGSISLSVLPPPANDNFANRINIPVPSTVTGTNVGASLEAGEPFHAGQPGAFRTVWWRYTPSANGEVTVNTFGSNFNTVLAIYTGNSVANLTAIAANDDAGRIQSQLTFEGVAGTSYAIAVAGSNSAIGDISLTVERGGGGNTTAIVAAVTPVTRATQVGSTVTAFATIINTGGVFATTCSVAVPGETPLTFSYRSRNHETGALGRVNEPRSIAAGARQDFLMSFTPTGTMQQELALVFDCANTPAAPSVVGLNTFLLIGTTAAPPADILSIAETATGDGIMNIPLGGTGFAALAAMNIGASAQIQARLSASSILSTGSALPNTTTMVICRTNPTTGACLATPTATVNFTPGASEIVTFTAFVASNGTAIPFNPASTRLFVHFFQGATPVGSASVAARTVPNGDEGPGETAALAD